MHGQMHFIRAHSWPKKSVLTISRKVVVAQEIIEPAVVIQLDTLTTGIYLVALNYSGRVFTQKLLIL